MLVCISENREVEKLPNIAPYDKEDSFFVYFVYVLIQISLQNMQLQVLLQLHIEPRSKFDRPIISRRILIKSHKNGVSCPKRVSGEVADAISGVMHLPFNNVIIYRVYSEIPCLNIITYIVIQKRPYIQLRVFLPPKLSSSYGHKLHSAHNSLTECIILKAV